VIPFGTGSAERLSQAARSVSSLANRVVSSALAGARDEQSGLAPGETTHMPLTPAELRGVMSGAKALPPREVVLAKRPISPHVSSAGRVVVPESTLSQSGSGGCETFPPGCGSDGSLEFSAKQLAVALDQHPVGRSLVHQIRQICGTTKDNVTVLQSLLHYINYPATLPSETAGGGVIGAGNVTGPATSADNAVARYDGTTGQLIQNSNLVVNDPAPEGIVVHTDDRDGALTDPLIVRPGDPTGSATGPGARLTLRGGNAGPVPAGFSGGDVELSGGIEPSGGPPGQVLVGPLSLDLNSPRLAAALDNNTGLSFLGSDILSLVTAGAYRLAIDSDGVVETTSGRRLRSVNTSANYNCTQADDVVFQTASGTTTLLEATPNGGTRRVIVNESSGTLTISRNGNKIDGAAADLTLPAGASVYLLFDQTATDWRIAGSYRYSPNFVEGPASATDNAIARYDGTTGKLIQNSDIIIDDASGGSVKFASTTGNDLSINAADGSSSAGRSLVVRAGDASGFGAANGGSVTLRAGANVNPGGTPGSLNLTGGRNQASGGTGGDASFDAGADTSGTGTGGAASLGTANAESVSIGRSGKTTTVNGLFSLPNDDIQISEGGTGASTEDGAINNIINGATALTSPAVDDYMALRDTSGAVGRKMRFDDFLKVINSLTADYAPQPDDAVATYDTSATAAKKVDLGTAAAMAALIMEFRLTGASGTPVMTSDSTAISTLYLAQYTGSRIALYDTTNSRWVVRNSAEVSLAITGRTTDLPFDVFAYWTGSAVALEFLNWSSATARATALARTDGVWHKSADASRRYIGTCRPRSATTVHWVTGTADSPAKFDIWNFYNRVNVGFRVWDTTNTWTYTTATWRQARASTNNQVDVVVGIQEDSISIQLEVTSRNSTISILRAVGLGVDSTSSPTGIRAASENTVASRNAHQAAMLSHQPGIGRHFYAWLEWSTATGTCTWVGDDGSTTLQSGMSGLWRC
jgi:hypothetical protein